MRNFNKNWYNASLSELVDYLEQSHKTIYKQLPKLCELMVKTLKTDRQYNQMLVSLNDIFSLFCDEMQAHFSREEKILIPYIRQIDWYDKHNGEKPQISVSSLTNPISQIEYEHDITENTLLKTMRIITANYSPPENSSDFLNSLYRGLQTLEKDIQEHIHIENNILFPKAIQTEMTVLHSK